MRCLWTVVVTVLCLFSSATIAQVETSSMSWSSWLESSSERAESIDFFPCYWVKPVYQFDSSSLILNELPTAVECSANERGRGECSWLLRESAQCLTLEEMCLMVCRSSHRSNIMDAHTGKSYLNEPQCKDTCLGSEKLEELLQKLKN